MHALPRLFVRLSEHPLANSFVYASHNQVTTLMAKVILEPPVQQAAVKLITELVQDEEVRCAFIHLMSLLVLCCDAIHPFHPLLHDVSSQQSS